MINLTAKEKSMKKFCLFNTLLGVLFSAPVIASVDDLDEGPKHECTSWMVFHNLTKNNTNILHKNRDAKPRDIVAFLSPADSPRKWIALGSVNSVNMGMNASGLAGVMNSGEICINPAVDNTKKTTPQLMRAVLESCDTAAQAVEKLKALVDSGDYWHKNNKGSIFFFLDPNEGFICEFTLKNCTVQRVNSDYIVRANIWQNPGMQMNSRNNIKSYLNSSARAYIAFSGLNAALDRHGKITLPDIFDLSRHWKMPEESPEKRSVCFKLTNSSSSLEIDRQYPGVLSCGYFTVGHPRHTIYVPIPVCAEKLHPALSDLTWSKAAWARFDSLGLSEPFPVKWQEFESSSFERFTRAKEEARKLLDSGKRDEAVKLLNMTAYAIWEEAAAILLPRK